LNWNLDKFSGCLPESELQAGFPPDLAAPAASPPARRAASSPVTVVTDKKQSGTVKVSQTWNPPGDKTAARFVPQTGGIVPAFVPPPLPSDDKRWKIVNGTMRKNGFARHALIETLHTVQSAFGYLDDDSIRFVAHSLRVPLSQAYGVVTFYHYFSLKPPGKHTMTICAGTACYIKGTDKLVAAAEKHLDISQGQTTKDGQVSLMMARCVGACSRAPVVLFDGEVAGEMAPQTMIEQLERWAVE
jgi:bidirectional [NiFe] hydrogenase diaphorase subunit